MRRVDSKCSFKLVSPKYEYSLAQTPAYIYCHKTFFCHFRVYNFAKCTLIRVRGFRFTLTLALMKIPYMIVCF